VSELLCSIRRAGLAGDGHRPRLGKIVNAGVTNGPHETIADVSTEEFTRLMMTNALSPMRVLEAQQGHAGLHYLDYLGHTVAW
jgi:hypothetical protein